MAIRYIGGLSWRPNFYSRIILTERTSPVGELRPASTTGVSCQLLPHDNRFRWPSLSAEWPFLVDSDRKLLYELDMADTTDTIHGDIFVPYTFILDGDRTIFKKYNGWWFLGRPTDEEIRMDLRALFSKRPDWIYSSNYRKQREQYGLPMPIPQHKIR
jgi:hypothetical protein